MYLFLSFVTHFIIVSMISKNVVDTTVFLESKVSFLYLYFFDTNTQVPLAYLCKGSQSNGSKKFLTKQSLLKFMAQIL